MGRYRIKRNLGMPKGMHKKGNNYYYVRYNRITRKNTWIRLGSPYVVALERYRGLRNYDNALPRFSYYQPHFAYLLSKARASASRKKITCELTVADVEAMWRRSDGRCEVTRIPFSYDFDDLPGGFLPWSPSIDRIKSKGDYTVENTRLVCLCANVAMNKWGEEILYQLAEFTRRPA